MTLKGKKNVYRCESCSFEFVTVDRDTGTTPMRTRCKNPNDCKGYAQSSFYRVDQALPPTYEWYSPNQAEQKAISNPAVKQHVDMGGLLLRKIIRDDGQFGADA